MKKFSVKDLAQIINAKPTEHADGLVSGVSTDSRTTRKGDCFFAVAGDNFDGHNYVADALAKGAACAVVHKDTADDDGTVLTVKDTVKALGDFAREYRRRMNFKVVAITGSVGKTTTRHIIYHVLRRHFPVHQAPKNFNNDIGLPVTLLGAEPQDQIVIAEIGSSYPGEIACLTRIAAPDVAVVTNVHPAHLAGFGDLETILQEKLSIAQGLGPDGTFIINADCDRLARACKADGRDFLGFGTSDAADIRFGGVTVTGSGSNFTIDGSPVDLPLPGKGYVENAVAAWAVCSQFGLTINDFAPAVKTLPAVPMRAELLQIGTLTVLNDCYNANPASMKNALDILTNLGTNRTGRLVFICGDMAELGHQSRELHVELGRRIAHANVQLLLAVGEFAQVTTEAAVTSAKHELQASCFKDTAPASNDLEKFVKEYDTVLVKGSRAAGLEMVVEKMKELFRQAPLVETIRQAKEKI